MPRNLIVVLLDSLNRHLLGAYGSAEFETPHIDRLARRALRFDRHFAGSLPCMPARHDILCGALDFLWKPWGSIELWEEPITVPLRAAGVTTMLVTDHPHLFESGGEIDHWFGRLLDAVDETGIADDTAIVLCTDHGHFLGEKDIWGKPGVPHYEPLGHIPLLVQWPGVEPRRVDALTTSVDLHATIADLFGVTVPHRTHGRSLLPLITGKADRVRDWALAGVFGRWVQVVDGRRKYARAPVRADNLPLSMWSNRWSTMPLPSLPELRLPRPDRHAVLDFMPGSDVPVLRQPFRPGGPLPYWSLGTRPADHYCFHLGDDPGETKNRLGSADERDLIELLRVAMREVEAPAEQFERLGLA